MKRQGTILDADWSGDVGIENVFEIIACAAWSVTSGFRHHNSARLLLTSKEGCRLETAWIIYTRLGKFSLVHGPRLPKTSYISTWRLVHPTSVNLIIFYFREMACKPEQSFELLRT